MPVGFRKFMRALHTFLGLDNPGDILKDELNPPDLSRLCDCGRGERKCVVVDDDQFRYVLPKDREEADVCLRCAMDRVRRKKHETRACCSPSPSQTRI